MSNVQLGFPTEIRRYLDGYALHVVVAYPLSPLDSVRDLVFIVPVAGPPVTEEAADLSRADG